MLEFIKTHFTERKWRNDCNPLRYLLTRSLLLLDNKGKKCPVKTTKVILLDKRNHRSGLAWNSWTLSIYLQTAE